MSTRILTLLFATAVTVAAAGCSAGPQRPALVAEAFFDAFASGDAQAAADLTNLPEKASAALASAWQNLQAESLEVRSGDARVRDRKSVV